MKLFSKLSFSELLRILTHSCFYNVRLLRAIRKSVSSSVFATIVHALICIGQNYAPGSCSKNSTDISQIIRWKNIDLFSKWTIRQESYPHLIGSKTVFGVEVLKQD